MEGKMKKTSQALSVILMSLLLVVALSSVSFAANKPLDANAAKNTKVVQPSVPSAASAAKDTNVVQQPSHDISLCKDPAVSNFNVTKTLSNNVATFTMTGQICNNGPGDYNQPDNILQAHFNVYAAYGPQFSYTAAGDVKFYTQNVGPVLKKNQCMPFTQVFTRDKVLQWGFKPPTAAVPMNERQMRLLFEFFVRDAKGTFGTVAQPKALDCNTNNNLSSQTFEMMISTQ
jgi:hypothetical protein